MKRTRLRPRSKKQQQKIDDWGVICLELMGEQERERGYTWCEICMLPERPLQGYNVWGHHKDKDRSNNTKENCLLTHYICHVNKFHGGMLEP